MKTSGKTSILLSAIGITTTAVMGCAALAQPSPQDWYQQGRATVERNLQWRTGEVPRAKNVILFVGDGMGISTVTAARILEGQLRGESGEENELFFETFPNVALSKTYNVNAQTADSAGTMTAMTTGTKTDAGLISVDHNVVRGDCASQQGRNLLTFLERAEMRGMATGVVSTATLTHATPAANYAHIMDRNFENDSVAASLANPGQCADIARQLIEFNDNVLGSDGLEVAMGGGRGHFMPASEADPESGRPGNRQDGRNLAAEWTQRYPDSSYVWNREQFNAIDPAATNHLLGLFQPSHMQFELDRPNDTAGEPSLSEMTALAIEILDKNEEGYYLNVEGGRIDHGHHATSPIRALTDAIEFSNAIRTAFEMVDMEETLIIVTADHSHVFTIAGYPARGNPILGKVIGLDDSGEVEQEFALAGDGLPYTTLGYANGPGYHSSAAERGQTRVDLTNVDTEAPDFRSETLVPMGGESHGGEDVAIYAAGPGSDLIRGVMEQHVIFHVMLEAIE